MAPNGHPPLAPSAQHGSETRLSAALLASTLALLLSGGLAVTYAAGSRACAPAPAPGRLAPGRHDPGKKIPPGAWNPMMLSLSDRKWVHDWVLTPVPSMVSMPRRQLSLELAVGALLQRVPGDFVETGVALGGTSILLSQALERYDPAGGRALWACDSFDGLPEPSPEDGTGALQVGARGAFNSSEAAFLANLDRFDVPPTRVNVLKGWFNETLPTAPIQRIAYLRLDGDLYSSTMDALEALYDRVSVGGMVYVDDYGSYNGCRRAVLEFRARKGVATPLQLQWLPDGGYTNGSAGSAWEAAWWIKTEE